MGEAYTIVNRTKKEFFAPHSQGNGYKFKEICLSEHFSSPNALVYLLGQDTVKHFDVDGGLRLSGRWANDNIAIVGEYSFDDEFNQNNVVYRDISDELRKEMEQIGTRYYLTLPRRWDR